MAKIGSNRNSSTHTSSQPNEPIKDERKETRKADGSTRDKASFETEDYKYDWDLYTDKIGDQRGSVGAGIKKEKNELYGKIDFNEKQVAKDLLFQTNMTLMTTYPYAERSAGIIKANSQAAWARASVMSSVTWTLNSKPMQRVNLKASRLRVDMT